MLTKEQEAAIDRFAECLMLIAPDKRDQEMGRYLFELMAELRRVFPEVLETERERAVRYFAAKIMERFERLTALASSDYSGGIH